MTDEDMRYCVDCKFCEIGFLPSMNTGVVFPVHNCTGGIRDLVTGVQIVRECHTARSEGEMCGPNAKRFEPKEVVDERMATD